MKLKEKITQIQVVAESAKDIWLRFERDFDPGLFESLARKYLSGAGLPAGCRVLGEGADQIAIGRPCGGGNDPTDYSMSLPKAGFLEESGDDGRKWLAALDRLRREARRRAFESDEETLIPPMHVSTKPPAIIMPVGQVTDAVPWAALENTRDLLADLGLELGDHPQIATWRGRYFIYDWSDLRKVSTL